MTQSIEYVRNLLYKRLILVPNSISISFEPRQKFTL